MTLTQAVVGFTALSAVLTVIPGLDTTLVLRTALTGGRRRAVAVALGINLGLLVWGCAAALGAAALLAASEVAFRVVTYAGVAYMAYLGISMIVRSFRTSAEDVGAGPGRGATPLWRASASGLTTNLLNPKIGIFYIATIPQFVPQGSPALATGMLLTSVHVLITLVWFTLVIVGARAARRWLASARATRLIDRVSGTAVLGLGAKLVLQHR